MWEVGHQAEEKGRLLGTRALATPSLTCMCVCARSCPTLCDPMDCSPPAASAHGILPARILERVAIPFSQGPSQPGTEPTSPVLHVDFFSYH